MLSHRLKPRLRGHYMATIRQRISKKTGNTHYHVKVRLKGFPQENAAFERKTDALKWAAQTESSMREGRYLKTAKTKKHTVKQVIERYIKESLPRHPKRKLDILQKLKWFEKELGHLPLSDLSRSIIIEKRSKLLNTPMKSGKPMTHATVNRYMSAFRHAFTIAKNEWEWIDENPHSRIAKLPEPRGRTRFLSDEERERLLDVCKRSGCKQLFLIVMLALSTGARQGEIMNLQWKDVDFDRRIITLHHTKNGERRILHISNHLLPLLTAHHEAKPAHSEYVFASPFANRPIVPRAAWDNAVKEAKLEDFRFHDLRHSAASYLAMNGATPNAIAEVLGHKTLAMVKRYAHLSESHVASIVEDMNNKVFG